jgi:valyl-tRNA synthetase
MLPIKEAESIMISSYPINNNLIFNKEKEILDKIIEDIVSIRNLKATNNITKNAKVNYKIKDEYKNIYINQLKLDRHEYIETTNIKPINYKSKYIDINYYEQKQEINSSNLEEINKLKASIQRREKLLSNENYVNKAPQNIVELDRKKLEEEKEKLSLMLEK